jgi:hypothetical protein
MLSGGIALDQDDGRDRIELADVDDDEKSRRGGKKNQDMPPAPTAEGPIEQGPGAKLQNGGEAEIQDSPGSAPFGGEVKNLLPENDPPWHRHMNGKEREQVQGK